VDRARKSSRGRNGQDGDSGRDRFAAIRSALVFRKPANDNRIGLKGWAERIVALALLIGLAALLVWKISG
jgi:hypothetical protein